MDETDPFHIYRINNGSMNNGSDYVFKFFRFIAENIAVCMDINEPYNILQEENAYFDATHNKSSWLQILWLMDIPSHNASDDSIGQYGNAEWKHEWYLQLFLCSWMKFWEKLLEKKNYMFNPRCFMCDEGGANYNAIKKVYGEEFCAERVHGCQFHFKNSVNQRSNKMMLEDQATFKQICKKLCEATTVAMSHVLKGHLDDMANKYEFLKPWIDW